MQAPAAILLDVYETVLVCDFERHFRGLADAAGVDFPRWSSQLEQFVPALVLGRMSIAEAFCRTLNACGVPSSTAHGDQLVRRDTELIIESSTLCADVLPSIRRWKSFGVKVVLVSNCVANTRPLLKALGLSDAVDATILSCEVGSAKPERRIYLHAAAAAGVVPENALFVDDQVRFCVGAERTGMRSIVIDRTRTASDEARPLIGSLDELGRDWPTQ